MFTLPGIIKFGIIGGGGGMPFEVVSLTLAASIEVFLTVSLPFMQQDKSFFTGSLVIISSGIGRVCTALVSLPRLTTLPLLIV